MNELVEKLYANNASMLYGWVKKILTVFGGITDKDIDDFVSVANEVITNILVKETYDETQAAAQIYVYRAIENKIKTEITNRNRLKRNPHDNEGNIYHVLSLDAPLNNSSDWGKDKTVEDYLSKQASDFDVFDEVIKKENTYQSEKITTYLSKLTSFQKKILAMRIKKISKDKIAETLNVSHRAIDNEIRTLKSFDLTKVFFKKDDDQTTQKFKATIKEDNNMNGNNCRQVGTHQKHKKEMYTTFGLIDQIASDMLIYEHPLQRESDRFSAVTKGNLISDMLQDNPIPPLYFAEEYVNDKKCVWNLDGKQRSMTCVDFYNNCFKISKNITKYNIEYFSPVLDKNGNKTYDDRHIPICEKKVCDIRGKKYSDLPEVLQKQFCNYRWDTILYFNCTNEDIEYHIGRHNQGKPTNTSERTRMNLGTKNARRINELVQMDFFKEIGGYKRTDFKNGTIQRVIAEMVMSVRYMDEWRKNAIEMGKFLKANVTEEDFEYIENMITRLEKITENNVDVADMFNAKDTFMWFAMFDKFSKLSLDDTKFAEFMDAFRTDLHKTVIDNVTFEDVNMGGTKDKNVIMSKLAYIEETMNMFFGLYDDVVNVKEETTDMKEAKEDMSDTVDAELEIETVDAHVEDIIDADEIANEDVMAEDDTEDNYISDDYEFDETWEQYVTTFAKSLLLKDMDIAEEQLKRIAVESMMLMDNRTDITDKAAKHYVKTMELLDTDVDDAFLYMSMLNDYSLALNPVYESIEPEAVPSLVGFMNVMFKGNVDDEGTNDATIIGLLKKWVNRLNTSDCTKKVENCKMLVKDFINAAQYNRENAEDKA